MYTKGGDEMTKVEIENELRRLRMQLEQYYSKRAKRTKERDEMERIINELHKKEQEIEKGIQQTLTTIKARVDKLNKKSKFRVRYVENAKRILYNSNSSNAIERVRGAERKAKNRCLELDGTINYYNRMIYATEKEICFLKQQLEQTGE